MIEAYQKLWPNRASVKNIRTQQELEQQILIELNDELTHPRVRKSKEEKLALAFSRIEQSDLTKQQKKDLVSLYKKIAAQ
ncbi:hypothetical protein [Planococcus salinus]|uniref:Uncharacterized protein n=1 Tax=Planococcus salinus TaxID=1848460 RepID=A0A3M8P9V6_9BACL|nr:hypothetical protein [Planococcus salinus]RNF40433.1 hypothetical protein EEX84_03130 [Planococcus salinus]